MSKLYHLFKRLLPHLSLRRKKQIVITFFLMIISSLAEVVSIGSVIPFLIALTETDRLLEFEIISNTLNYLSINSQSSIVLFFTLAFIALTITATVIRLFLLTYQTKLSYAIGADLSVEVYKKTLFQPYSELIKVNSSDLISGIINQANSIPTGALNPLLNIISCLLTSFGILFAIIAVDPIITTLTFAVFAAMYLFVTLFTKNIVAKNGERIKLEEIKILKSLQEGIGAIRDVLINSSQATYLALYRKSDLPMRAARANNLIISTSPRLVVESLAIILIVFLAYFLYTKYDGLSDSLPLLGVIGLGAQRILPILQLGYAQSNVLIAGIAHFEGALILLEKELPKYIENTSSEPISFSDKIVLKDVSFEYSESNPVIENFNIEIKKGSCIGIIGETGSGKSTILDILMGLIEPTKGNLMIDGKKIDKSNVNKWQEKISHVPQNIFLADISAAQNIAFGLKSEDLNLELIKESAKAAFIHEKIISLPDGYSASVGERGVQLSGGQKQRIGIARALYQKPEVLILDEATSALDLETEEKIMKSIEALSDKITIIMVAHRHASLKNCDYIFKISNGKIETTMTYNELIRN